MKVIIQRVHQASVLIDTTTRRSIGAGMVVYVGISHEALAQRSAKVEKFVQKLAHLKIFEDHQGKINASLLDIQGELLLISNFTLHGRNHKGNQIDFSKAAGFADAKTAYDELVHALVRQGIPFQTGEFGSYMQIDCSIDGPVNLILEY